MKRTETSLFPELALQLLRRCYITTERFTLVPACAACAHLPVHDCVLDIQFPVHRQVIVTERGWRRVQLRWLRR